MLTFDFRELGSSSKQTLQPTGAAVDLPECYWRSAVLANKLDSWRAAGETYMLPDWDRCFPHCEPIGYHLRAAFAARWVRFHSLPDSKRYPEDDAEYAEVLARHNTILGELTQPGQKVVLVTTGYSESPVPSRSYPGVIAFDPGAVPWRTVAMRHIEGAFTEPNYWHLFSSVREWRPGEFDPLIRLVADDAVANVLMVAQDCQWVLHPYDGGMDVIVKSAEERESLRVSHSEWLSARADGL